MRRAVFIPVAGAVTGLVATLLFATVHAFLIWPIWGQVVQGIPFAMIVGTACAWAFSESGSRNGLEFGARLWLLILPVTVIGAASRLAGLHAWNEPLEITLIMAAAVVAGWLGSPVPAIRARVAFVVAMVLLVMVMGGAIPVTNGRRATWLWLGFLPILLGTGITIRALDHKSAVGGI